MLPGTLTLVVTPMTPPRAMLVPSKVMLPVVAWIRPVLVSEPAGVTSTPLMLSCPVSSGARNWLPVGTRLTPMPAARIA